jgi:hypothetical protein
MYKAKKVYEFQQGRNPYDTMGIGYKARVKTWINKWMPFSRNIIYTDNTVIFTEEEYLGYRDFKTMPDGMIFKKGTKFSVCKNLIKLPNRLIVHAYLNIKDCDNLMELPKDLIVKGPLWLDDRQKELFTIPTGVEKIGGE